MSDIAKAIEALRNCPEADHDGVTVFASRPAIDKVCDEIERLQDRVAEQQRFIDAVLPIIDVLAFDRTPRFAGLTYQTLCDARSAAEVVKALQGTEYDDE